MHFFELILLYALLVLPALANNNFDGLTVANNIGGAGTYTCRTQAQWKEVANKAKAQGFKAIRILGFDCNALELASSAAAGAGIKVMAGIFVDGTIANGMAQINRDVESFRKAFNKYGAGRYVGLTIGNEVDDTPAHIMDKVHQVQKHLKSVGVSTQVSTVHIWVNIRDNLAFCSSDFVGANAHAFYDGGRTSGQAGDFVSKTVIPALHKACPNKKIYITETGWPSRGAKNGVAVPSVQDERKALHDINCAARNHDAVPIYAFEYDNQLWKGNDNERSFGIFGKIDLGAVFSCSANVGEGMLESGGSTGMQIPIG